MPKRILPLFLVLWLLIPCLPAAQAESADLHEVYYTGGYDMFKCQTFRPGEYLFFSSIGSLNNAEATLICADENGQIKWAIQSKDDMNHMSQFRTAVPLNNDKYIAVRYVSADSPRSVLSVIQYGNVLREVTEPYNITGIYPAETGFLEFAKMGIKNFTIRKLDIQTGLIWEKTYDEPWFLTGCLLTRDGYIAYGTHIIKTSDYPVGVVVKFDFDGNVKWKHLSANRAEFTGGVAASDNSVVVCGNTFGIRANPGTASAYGTSFIAKYDETGLVFQTDYRIGDKKESDMQAILETDGGYVLACVESQFRAEVKLLLTDLTGAITDEWTATTGNIGKIMNFSLHPGPNGILLAAYGIDVMEKPHTILRKIALPKDHTADRSEDVEQLIADWTNTYMYSDAWNLQKKAVENSRTQGLPGEGAIPYTDAMRILLTYITKTYTDISINDLKTMRPHLTFRVDYETPQWQIDLLPMDTNDSGFTGYIYAESGIIRLVVYGPGNG